MSAPENDYAARRALLSAQIARQRVELDEAYRRLEKPIRYAEYGMRTFSFLRANPWIFAAVPAAFRIVPGVLGFFFRKPAPAYVQSHEQHVAKTKKGFLKTWLGRGVAAYQIYKRVRSHLP